VRSYSFVVDGLSCAGAEAFDGDQDVIGRFDPAKGLWFGIVVLVKEGGDRRRACRYQTGRSRCDV
jgi:hypothetical protein